MREAGKLKIIANSAMGVDNIDLAAAKELGIAVANVPDYCFNEVAEHAMALILCLLRDVYKRLETFEDLKAIQTKVRELCTYTEC